MEPNQSNLSMARRRRDGRDGRDGGDGSDAGSKSERHANGSAAATAATAKAGANANASSKQRSTAILFPSLLLLVALLLFLLFPSRHPDSRSDSDFEHLESDAHAAADKDALINLDHGDPIMFEPFWKNSGDKATVVIPGWHTMSYFSDPSHLCWFLEPLLAHQLRRLHRLVGNAVAHDRHIVVGVGSTQLIHAVLFALSSHQPHSLPVVSAAPYYSVSPSLFLFLFFLLIYYV